MSIPIHGSFIEPWSDGDTFLFNTKTNGWFLATILSRVTYGEHCFCRLSVCPVIGIEAADVSVFDHLVRFWDENKHNFFSLPSTVLWIYRRLELRFSITVSTIISISCWEDIEKETDLFNDVSMVRLDIFWRVRPDQNEGTLIRQ